MVFRPASWQDWLLIVLLLAGGAVAVLLLWRWRQRDLVYQKRALEDAVQRRTQDLESEKKELLNAREQMRHYAERDGLTGLWNHRIIIDQLRREVDRAQRNGTPLSVILADLDRFKSINDTFGHPCGDAVLRAIAEILTCSVRSYDWVGRYGGEEFLIILPGASVAHARSRAEQLRASIESARIPDGNRNIIQMTASLGVASGVPADFEGLLRAADAALYRAKHSGRNCVVATEVDPPCQP
ncbi:MAG: GGDEF domain-containing protein [Acidobacteriota bacterium]